MSDTQDYRRLHEVFAAVCELPPPARAPELDRLCAGDSTLRRRVEELLRFHEQERGPLERKIVDDDPRPRDRGDSARFVGAATTAASPVTEGPGTTIGRYKLLQRIGEGGFGIVYMAEQEQPVRRRVALKIIKLGMDTRQVIARFEAERQALALMDHPNIAKVLDAGATDTGRPYFVMELVRGDPVTDYCDRNSLGTRERLELFAEICHAVQHAHQKGVIHRDIKPSNVLVTVADGRPVSKVIDFGIAKATNARLTEKTLFTEFRQLVGTPEYMSPEQAEMSGVDIDTRSDIYSLGVLLYELLTGTTPFSGRDLRGAGFGEIQRIIREAIPDKPSTRLSSLIGSQASDDERDSSAEVIARHRHTDVRTLTRTLRGDLDWIVMKCLEKDRTRRYETANGLALDIGRYLGEEPVLAGPPSASYRLRKFVRRNRVPVAVAAVITLLVLGGIAGTGLGLVWALREAEAARIAQTAESHALAEASRQREIAEAINRFLTQDLLATVAPSSRAGRGRDVLMRDVLDEAAKRIEEAARPGGRLADKPEVEAAIRETLSDTYWYLGEYDTARPHAERALTLRRAVLGEDHPSTLDSMNDLANVLGDAGREDEACRLYERVLEVRRTALGERHPATLTSMHNLAVSYKIQRRYAEAEPLFEETLDRRTEVLGAAHADTLMTMDGLAGLRMDDYRLDEAEPIYLEAIALARESLGDEHAETLRIIDNLALLRKHQRRGDEAERLFKEVVAARRRILGVEHPMTLKSLFGLADLYVSQNRVDEAEPMLRELVTASGRVLGDEHPQTLRGLSSLAEMYWRTSRPVDAEPIERRIIAIHTKQLGEDHVDTLTAMNNLAVTCVTLGRYAEAEQLYDRVYEGRRSTLGADHPLVHLTAGNLGRLHQHWDQGRQPESIEWLERAIAGLRTTLGVKDLRTRNVMRWLIEAYYTADRPDDAVSLRREMLEYMIEAAGSPDATHPQLNGAAWELLTVEEELRDYALALTFARRAADLTDHANPIPLDTYALALFENGHLDEAVRTQRRALELLPGSAPDRGEYEERLTRYEAAVHGGTDPPP